MTQLIDGVELLTASEVKGLMELAERGDDAARSKVFEMLRRDRNERCKVDFLYFVQQMWPVFISGKHHAIMADAFERVARGELKRLIINMPPRHTKS